MRMPNVGTTGVAATNRTPALYRRGIVTIEIILTLPIFIIAVMAIVELGLLVSNEQIVEMSSRAGTQVASELATIPSSGSVPVSVQAAASGQPVCRPLLPEGWLSSTGSHWCSGR